MARKKTYNTKGIRYKIRDRGRLASKYQKWEDKDSNYRSLKNFSKMIIREMGKELDNEGFVFKEMTYKSRLVIVVKKNRMLTKFYVPFIPKDYYRAFILEGVARLRDSYKDFIDNLKEDGK